MTLTDARSIVRAFAREAEDDDVYEDSDVDVAIQFIFDDFTRNTKCLRTIDGLATVASNSAIALNIDEFVPERLMRLWIPTKTRVRPVDLGDIIDLQIAKNETGIPNLLAFQDNGTALVYPTPDAVYTIQMQWWQGETPFEAGTEDPDDVEFRMPDDLLRPCLVLGAPAILQLGSVEAAYGTKGFQQYLAYRDQMADAGTFTLQTSNREMLEE